MEYNKTELKKYNYLIGQKIKAVRDLKGFKQDYVAEKLGISSGHYSNLENGHKTCTLYILIRLCRILDTTPNELLEGCISSIHEGKEPLTIEIQRPLNKEERAFLLSFQVILNKYLEDKK